MKMVRLRVPDGAELNFGTTSYKASNSPKHIGENEILCTLEHVCISSAPRPALCVCQMSPSPRR